MSDDWHCTICGVTGLATAKRKQLYAEQVCSTCRTAHLNKRQIGFVVDAIVLGIGGRILAAMLVGDGGADSISTLAYLLSVPLFACRDGFNGQSLGKRLCGLQVIDEKTGRPAGLGASIKRNLVLNIPFVPLIAAIQLGEGHRIGDGWARTKVIEVANRNKVPFLGSEERANVRDDLALAAATTTTWTVAEEVQD